MVRAWHVRGMASMNQTRPHCVNQMGKTHSKPLAAQHGRGTAWARHVMCESAFTAQRLLHVGTGLYLREKIQCSVQKTYLCGVYASQNKRRLFSLSSNNCVGF